VPSTVTTTGPLLWVLLVFGILTCGAAVLLVIDAVRRASAAFARVPESRWPYVVAGALYTLAYAAWWFSAVRAFAPWVGHIVLFGAPVLLLTGAAYLLRVVYPKQPRSPEDTESPDLADEPELHEET
jgi:hypothetical protein